MGTTEKQVSLDNHSVNNTGNVNQISQGTHQNMNNQNAATFPRSVMEQELLNLRENIRSIELEQLKTKVQNMESLIMHQKQLAGVLLLSGSPQYPYIPHFGGYWVNPGYTSPIPKPQVSPHPNSYSQSLFSHDFYQNQPMTVFEWKLRYDRVWRPSKTTILHFNTGTNLSYCPTVPTIHSFHGRYQQVPQPPQGLRHSYVQRPHRIYNHSGGVVASSTGHSFPDPISTGTQQFRDSSAVRILCGKSEIYIALGKPQQQIQPDAHCSIENPTEITVTLPETDEEARPRQVELSDSPLRG